MYWLRKHIREILAVGITALLVTACAAIQPDVRAKVMDPGIARSGDTIELHYADDDAANEFCPGALLTVYRFAKTTLGPSYREKFEVGTIKVKRNLAGGFIEGVVVDGPIRAGDVALRADDTCELKMSQLRQR